MCLCVFQADDAVYLSDESLLQEYVLNEDGAIYMGTWDNMQCLPWNYGQVTITPKHLTLPAASLGTLCDLEWLCVHVCQVSQGIAK